MRRLGLLVLCTLLLAWSGASAVTQPLLPQPLPRAAVVPVPGAFVMPVAMAQHPDSDDLYVVEKTGTIRAVRDGVLFDPVPVLDISSEVSSGLEQGLLGLAFAPDGMFAYVYFTDVTGDAHLHEFVVADGALLAESRRDVLTVEQHQDNHNGGSLAFGPDGYLYLGLGDGGGAGDPMGNGQDRTTLPGSLLRIDPRPSGDDAYTVPVDNPFAATSRARGPKRGPRAQAAVDARPEIWAYGLRNPWKFSFDRATGDLWIGDVGQSAWEEINLQRADSTGGENYGWNHMEGLELYTGRPPGAEEPVDHHPPIHVYPNGGGSCAVTGGYVYRGQAISWLEGAYVYSDWCDGELRYIREVGGEVVEDATLGITVPLVASFGEDHRGELYAISLAGAVVRIIPLA